MRKLMWFSLGFLAACLICALFLVDAWLIAGCVGFCVLFTLCLVLGWKYPWLNRAAAICLGLSLGLGWFHVYSNVQLGPAASLDGETVSLRIQAMDYGWDTGYGTAVDGRVTVGAFPCKVRVYMEGTPDIEPGDVILGEFILEYAGAGEIFRRANGAFLTAYQAADAQLAKPMELPWLCRPAIWRQELVNILENTFPEDTSAFAKALLLGERADLDYETSTAFRLSGISHVVAVSGLHVTILFSVIFTLGLHRRFLTALIGIPVLVLFAAVAGFSPSINRACIMQILMILAYCLEKDYDRPTALSFAALVMMAVNPLVVLSISFQLSVGCMAGILLFYDGISEWLRKYLPRLPADGIAITLSAVSLTTPLAALYFGCVSLVGVLTNLLILWVVTFIFWGLLLVCVLALFWGGGAVRVAWLISWPIRYVLVVAKILSRFPLAAVYTCNVYVVVWLAFLYILLTIFLLQRRKQPGTLLCCGVMGLALALGISWAEPMMDDCRVTVLDVGQGQCILLQSEGRTWMVDCGGSDDESTADLAADTLLSQGVTRLDGLILTHYDRDHAGAAEYLLTRIPADVVMLPDMPDPDGVGEKIANQAENAVLVNKDLALSYGSTEVTVFAPLKGETGNESSLCVLFRAANCDILITGDRTALGELLLMRETTLPQLEILIAGHHGSANSTSEELLAATNPAIVAISVGNNPYGHPSPDLLDRLVRYGCAVYRTKTDGNLIFRR